MTFTTSTSAQELIGRSGTRKCLLIENEDGTDSVFIKRERENTPTVTSSNHDWKILPGGKFEITDELHGVNAVQDRWTVIASANTPRVAVFEIEIDSVVR